MKGSGGGRRRCILEVLWLWSHRISWDWMRGVREKETGPEDRLASIRAPGGGREIRHEQKGESGFILVTFDVLS